MYVVRLFNYGGCSYPTAVEAYRAAADLAADGIFAATVWHDGAPVVTFRPPGNWVNLPDPHPNGEE